MAELLRLSLLLTAADCTAGGDTLLAVCSEDTMLIHSKKHDQFWLNGDEMECQPENGNFSEYDGSVVRVQTWSLPLSKGSDGPCGLRFVPVDNSQWAHEITMHSNKGERTVRCSRFGLLDKRGAHIGVEQLTPSFREITQEGGTVEVPRMTTLSAFFPHRFPEEAGLSLYPVRCWIINDRNRTRRMVVDAGCPLTFAPRNRPLVNLGAETATDVESDTLHIFFNANEDLFVDEDPLDLPPFRLQCDVLPCKGVDFHHQIVGVPRCPSIAWCQHDRKLADEPTGTFEVNMAFNVNISSSSSVANYRRLGQAIYPGEYWIWDTAARNATYGRTAETAETGIWKGLLLLLALAALVLLAALLVARRHKSSVAQKLISEGRRRFGKRSEGDTEFHEKRETIPMAEVAAQ